MEGYPSVVVSIYNQVRTLNSSYSRYRYVCCIPYSGILDSGRDVGTYRVTFPPSRNDEAEQPELNFQILVDTNERILFFLRKSEPQSSGIIEAIGFCLKHSR